MARTKPDLFRFDPPEADLAYRNIRNEKREPLQSIRAHCEDIWETYWRYADDHFVTQFPINFHQRWFEMHLTVSLLRVGLSVQCPKPGPDVLIEMAGRRVWIEAIAPTGGANSNPDAVREPAYGSGVAFWVPRTNIVLRVAQAFCEKSKKFAGYLRDGIVNPEDACVIAINLRRIPHAAFDARDYLLAALYAVGDQYVTIDRKSGLVTGEGVHHRPELTRTSGAAVGTDVFLVPDHSHVSAVIGSWADVANGTTRMGDDFLLFPNIHARIPLPPGAIPLGHEFRLHDQGTEWSIERVSHLLEQG